MPSVRLGPAPTARIDVRKTYKLYIGGAFPRSEIGPVVCRRDAPTATPLANACRASRKDLRDAVRAARKAFEPWADRTAMNRGQVLYRVAELMEGRRDQFVAEVAAAEGLRAGRARDAVDRAIDRWVWYAGWADKIGQVLGSSNPVAAPYFNFTIPEPTGVVGVVAPERSSLLGLVSRLAPAARQRQRGGRARLGDAAAAGRHPDRGPRHVGRAGRRHQPPDRAQAGARAGARGPRRRRRASTSGASPADAPDRGRVLGRRQRQAAGPTPTRRRRRAIRLGSTTARRSAPSGSPPSSR